MPRKQADGRRLSLARLSGQASHPHWILTWGPVLAVMVMIYALSSRPEFGGSGLFENFLTTHFADSPFYLALLPVAAILDRYGAVIGHLTEFAVLAIVTKRALDRQWPAMPNRFLAAWLVTLLYGVVDEWHQRYVPGRHSDPYDVLIDGLGASLGLLLLWLWHTYRS